LILIIIIPSFLFFPESVFNSGSVEREKTDILVLEGFVSDYVLADAIREFQAGSYIPFL